MKDGIRIGKRSLFHELLVSVFRCFMAMLMPFRKRGYFGTYESPRYFKLGDSCPWWLQCRWPLTMPLKFTRAVETYYEAGFQVYRPTNGVTQGSLFDEINIKSVVLVGAPTSFCFWARTVDDPYWSLIEGAPYIYRPAESETSANE
jgi:hypothetical protein